MERCLPYAEVDCSSDGYNHEVGHSVAFRDDCILQHLLVYSLTNTTETLSKLVLPEG